MNNLVAVYGSLREGFGNHALLEGSSKLSEEVTDSNYTMLDLGAFPGVLLEGETPITIEVYEVDEPTFQRLDMLEGYPSFYDRIQIDTSVGKAWMYFLDRSDNYSNSYVPSGDWSEKLKSY
jgi:gamma-glutamylcyclotransferase (GGCT)/AIG2-like uncharacterized protein YtfP